MRSLALVALVVFPLGLAQADRKKPRSDPRLTVVDDEPTSRDATQKRRADPSDPQERGARREVVLEAPAPQPLHTDAVRERAQPHEAPPADTEATVSDAVAELAARQMRRNQPSIDACVAAAAKRAPAATGTVTLLVDVRSRKVHDLRITRDDVHDYELGACLLRAGRGWTFSLGRATFNWPVTLAPTASR
jgi:hypothetical protein